MNKKRILRVRADDAAMKRIYTIFSKFMGLIEKSEKSLRKRSFELLEFQIGEKVLEIGFGRGTALIEISKAISKTGEVYGIDLTPEMVKIAKKNLAKNHISNVNIQEGDARNLPYEENFFDVVYMASTLELFDTPDIPIVLSEIKRVLKNTGRICIVSIPRKGREDSFIVRIYEWFHRNFQSFASCRPIYLEDSIKRAGYKIIKTDVIGILFPMKIVIAKL
jgi:demethylmenaquinone methyltransferase/2-methoxy-6-polyprenyl-1,4-benzoquinol methylase